MARGKSTTTAKTPETPRASQVFPARMLRATVPLSTQRAKPNEVSKWFQDIAQVIAGHSLSLADLGCIGFRLARPRRGAFQACCVTQQKGKKSGLRSNAPWGEIEQGTF